jgi:hypothetical protein
MEESPDGKLPAAGAIPLAKDLSDGADGICILTSYTSRSGLAAERLGDPLRSLYLRGRHRAAPAPFRGP